MSRNVTPNFGCLQPTFRRGPQVAYSAMPGPKRPKHIAIRTRRIIARNILARMEQRYRDNGDKLKALAEDAGTSYSTIQRATQPDRYSTGITVDVLTQIAMGLRCEPADLLADDDREVA